MFKMYFSNLASQATKKMAFGVLTLGLMLVGFGMLIIAFPQLFAWMVASIFFFAGLVCLISALKMYVSYRRYVSTTRTYTQHTEDRPPHGPTGRIHELDDFDDK